MPSAADRANASAIAVVKVEWRPCWRIIPSRFPPIALFEEVADPADLEAVLAVEALTNDRLREEAGQLSLVPPEDRISGPGTSVIMAAFTHPNPAGSRFSDGSYGVFYAACDLDTAIAETAYHRARFMAATAEPAQELDMRVYAADLAALLHDLRPLAADCPEYYDHEDYAPPQDLARHLRKSGSEGVVYESVRRRGGECAAVFRPRLLENCRQAQHLTYRWDGTSIAGVYEKRALVR